MDKLLVHLGKREERRSIAWGRRKIIPAPIASVRKRDFLGVTLGYPLSCRMLSAAEVAQGFPFAFGSEKNSGAADDAIPLDFFPSQAVKGGDSDPNDSDSGVLS